MRKSASSLAWALGAFICAVAGALVAFPLWLDAPAGRSNPLDPKSALYFTNTPAAAGSPTDTFTISPTPSITNTVNGTFTYTPASSPTPSATPTNSPTPTPFIWYDGDSAGATGADVSFYSSAGTAGIWDQLNPGAGQGGSNYYAQLSMGATAYDASGTIARAAQNLSAFSALEFYIKVPTGTGGCFTGSVVLVGSGASPNDQSRPVTITPYLVVHGPVTEGTWLQVKIPLSAFYGDNHNLGTFSAGDLSSLLGVKFRPYYSDFDSTGGFTGEAYFDNVRFTLGAAPAVHQVGWIFSDFEQSDRSNWGTYWSAYSDRTGGAGGTPEWPASDCIVNGDPDGMSPATNITYPSYPNPPQDSSDGSPDTPCTSGHISGMKGDDGDCVNPWSDLSCCGDGTGAVQHWSYAGMGCSFDWTGAGGSVDVTAANILGAVPTGLRVKVKAGPQHQAGQNYILSIAQQQVTCGGCEFQTRISDGDLQPYGTWITIDIPFPAVGTLGKSAGDPAIDTTFGQPSWVGTEITWDFNLKQIGFGPEIDELTFDLFVDDIQFY
jgi:hypothetical protein